ncbi:MAG: M48 family metallopeptidase [Rhodocyclaceae bacterium]
MTASAFATLFVVVLMANLAIKLTLMIRQIRHVTAERERVPAPFTESISLSSHRKAADYTRARMRLALFDLALGALFILAMTLGGGLDALYGLLARWLDAGSLGHGVGLLAALGLLGWLIELPFGLYRTFGIEKRFGFNRMTPTLFVSDLAKSGALATLIGLPLLALVIWLMEAAGELWWLWVWAVWLTFNLLAAVIWPTLIAPMFNRFTPLSDDTLKARVEALLARCGFKSKGLFVMDGSRRSAHGNAYFTGFGTSKRIVFFDTLLNKLDPAEVEAVLAHELGHFHHGHIWKRLVVMAALALAILAFLGWLVTQAWFFAGLGVSFAGTATALALFSLVLPVFAFPLGPIMSHWSRACEFEADRYAADQTRADDLVHALVKLYRDNAATLTPDPWYSRFFDSHPPAVVRVSHLRAIASQETR